MAEEDVLRQILVELQDVGEIGRQLIQIQTESAQITERAASDAALDGGGGGIGTGGGGAGTLDSGGRSSAVAKGIKQTFGALAADLTGPFTSQQAAASRFTRGIGERLIGGTLTQIAANRTGFQEEQFIAQNTEAQVRQLMARYAASGGSVTKEVAQANIARFEAQNRRISEAQKVTTEALNDSGFGKEMVKQNAALLSAILSIKATLQAISLGRE